MHSLLLYPPPVGLLLAWDWHQQDHPCEMTKPPYQVMLQQFFETVPARYSIIWAVWYGCTFKAIYNERYENLISIKTYASASSKQWLIFPLDMKQPVKHHSNKPEWMQPQGPNLDVKASFWTRLNKHDSKFLSFGVTFFNRYLTKNTSKEKINNKPPCKARCHYPFKWTTHTNDHKTKRIINYSW